MSVGFRERNEALLKSRFPGLAEALAASRLEEGPAIESALGASGEPTCSVGGRLLHSRFDPRKEARRLLQDAAGDGPLVVFGFGLGYLAEEAAAAFPGRPLVIAEADLRILDFALGARDLEGLLTHPELAFAAGGSPEGAAEAAAAFPGSPRALTHRASRDLAPAWYDAAEAALRRQAARAQVNAATLKKFGARWVRNLAANLESLRDFPGVSRLEGWGTELPALLLAAGPSLDAVLPVLGELSRRCVVVAVDTALRACLSAGVEPDFVLVVDPQYWNARHLDRCPSPRSVLVTESAAYPPVLRHPFAARFLCSSLFPLGRYLENRVDPKGELGAGGSVATTAWDFVRVLGCSPIYVAGLDLSFPDLKTHFKGALFEERVHAEALRVQPGETRSFRALRDGRPFKAPDASGGTVLTDQRLSIYAAWFEANFARWPEAGPLSFSGRGLRIEGLRSADPASVLARPARREEIDARREKMIREVRTEFAAQEQRRGADFARALSDLRSGLEELASIAEAATLCVGAAKPGAAEKLLAELDRANARIAASRAKDVAGFLFPPLEELSDGLENEGTLEGHLELSRRLYGSLARSARLHLELLGSRRT